MPPKVVLVVSTGRCGTQWLSTTLTENYANVAIIEHEPLSRKYAPNQFFRRWHSDDLNRLTKRLSGHFENIDSTISSGKNYIDFGWTTYSAVPALIRRFESRIHLIHLHRHPVHVALSYLSHKYYQPELRSDWFTQRAQLTPRCPGVYRTSQEDRWSTLNSYEKALFHWYQINKYALELHERWPTLPYCSVSFDDIFNRTGKCFEEMIKFMGLEPQAAMNLAIRTIVDGYSNKLARIPEWRTIFQFPEVVELAIYLGYEIDEVDDKQLIRRYSTYRPSGVINAGFTSVTPTLRGIENGEIGEHEPGAGTNLIFYVRFFGLQTGDRQRLHVFDPRDGIVAETTTAPAQENKAQWMQFIGHRPPPQGWPSGIYRGRFELLRDGVVVLTAMPRIEIP